jgi:hypothetical protein
MPLDKESARALVRAGVSLDKPIRIRLTKSIVLGPDRIGKVGEIVELPGEVAMTVVGYGKAVLVAPGEEASTPAAEGDPARTGEDEEVARHRGGRGR